MYEKTNKKNILILGKGTKPPGILQQRKNF